jgi:arylsulfatase A-like enzyme
LKKRCLETDQACVALINDLKQRGLLDSTLVVWGGEFGRTPMMQGALKPDQLGRDHHPHGYTVWLAGGGIKGGIVHGKTDDFGFYAVEDKVHVHDLHATILHLFGLEHTKLTYRFQGRDFRLTDVQGEIVHKLLA